MRFIHRGIERELIRASRGFPALLLTGPRRSGKTTLLKELFPQASYYLLEDPETVGRFRSDPREFLNSIRTPAILDEIQNVPEMFNYLRARIDRFPNRKGLWYLTGSQEAPLMRGVSESMAGRAAIFQLLPLSLQESPKVSLLRGGFPEVLARPSAAPVWFRSYVQTYLERDVRAVSSIRDLSQFRRFLVLLASRCGQLLNKTDLASALNVSVPTITEWLSILEITMQILIVPPFYENFGKRMIKSPKIYFVDSGLACQLLGLDTEKALLQSPFLGALFEGFLAAEIIKYQVHTGRRRELYYFRDQQGLEVDFLIPIRSSKLILVEAKTSRTLLPAMGSVLQRLGHAISKKRGYSVEKWIIHRPNREEDSRITTVCLGVRSASVEELVDNILPKS